MADLTGQRLNLFVDGVCIKVGINGDVASYYENRLATGTYEVEVRSQYTSNNVESFGLKKTVSIKADPGLSGEHLQNLQILHIQNTRNQLQIQQLLQNHNYCKTNFRK